MTNFLKNFFLGFFVKGGGYPPIPLRKKNVNDRFPYNSSIQDRYHIILYAHFEEFPNCGQNLVSPKMTEPALVPAICAAHTNGAAKVLGNRRPTLPRDQNLGQYHFTPQLLTIFRHLFIVQSICFKHLFARLLLWIDIFELRMTRQFQMMRLCD